MRFLLVPALLLGFCVPAIASTCGSECRAFGDGTRKAALQCEVACERQDPAKVAYCKEYTPCLLACEERIPRETIVSAAVRDEKTACNGVCMSKFFRIGCAEPTAIPEDHPRVSVSQAARGHFSASETAVAPPTPHFVEGGGERSAARDVARRSNSPSTPLPRSVDVRAGPGGLLGAKTNAPAAKGEAPVADLMMSVLADAGSAPQAELTPSAPVDPAALTIFQRVHRKYREREGR